MAKGQHLSPYQQKIVRRYYDQADNIRVQRLQETISDLAVAETPKAAEKLWKRALDELTKLGVEPARVEKVAGGKDLKALAALVGELVSKK